MSKYLVTLQKKETRYNGFTSETHKFVDEFNRVCEFAGDLPTEREIKKISADGYMSNATILFMQKLAD